MKLFIFHEILIVINVLSNKLQQKNATLRKTAGIIKAVIENFEKKKEMKILFWYYGEKLKSLLITMIFL